jgi:hypothetical protein
LDVYAAGAFQNFVDGVEAEILDLLPGNDGNALRRFAQGERELGGSGGRPGGVGAGAFGGGVAFALRGNGDRGEDGFFFGRGCCEGGL